MTHNQNRENLQLNTWKSDIPDFGWVLKLNWGTIFSASWDNLRNEDKYKSEDDLKKEDIPKN